MKVSKLLQTVLAVAAVVVVGTGGAQAVCIDPLGGFAIFQCAELVYVEPPPGPPPVIDANGRVASGVTATYWQLGFGNTDPNRDNGLGSTGTGNSGATATTFNGNDKGISIVDVVDMSFVPGGQGAPAGSLCLGVNNWGNQGIDGCCDNPRNTVQGNADDNILNEYYNPYLSASGYPGYYSLAWQQDYPMAALLKTADGAFFAAMAVATASRNNDGTGTNGPCAPVGAEGTNPSPCDFRTGSFNFKDVKNGNPNPLLAGNPRNVVPWQQVPRPKLACTSGCAGTGPRTLNISWNPTKWFHDNSHRGTTNSAMGGADCLDAGCPTSPTRDATRAPGVGVRDLMTMPNPTNNWAGLMRYNLQQAPVTAAQIDPNGNVITSALVFANVAGQTDIVQPPTDPNGNPNGVLSRTGVTSNPDTCWRVQVLLGKKPEVAPGSTTPANSRLGKSGDSGFTAQSLAPGTITCVGGALAAETLKNPKATRRQGDYVITWDTSAELGVSSFQVSADTIKGAKSIGTVTCQKCSTGEGASYTFKAPTSTVKAGVKTITIEMISANGNQKVTVPLS